MGIRKKIADLDIEMLVNDLAIKALKDRNDNLELDRKKLAVRGIKSADKSDFVSLTDGQLYQLHEAMDQDD
jgi:hypothetical protein